MQTTTPRRVALAILAAGALALGGCAALTPKTPEQTVTERAEARWGALVKGDFDHVAEQAFFNVGGISDVEEKWAQIQRENG